MVVCEFFRTAGLGEKLGSSFKPTVTDSVMENQTRVIGYDVETGIANFQ